ncbi:MAG TPA: helix-turn-helix transcriptional regulator [Thermoanaerobacterales bacterium]|nr:helix-turn-helix transcriptional regulator [Thermoanaerobacterales bacterium]
MKLVSVRLNRALVLRDITISELAHQAGISQSYVSHLAKGERLPTITTLRKLAKALNVRVSFFLEEDISPLQSVYHQFPENIQEFLAKKNSLEYLRVAKMAAESNIPPQGIRKIIEVIKDANS